MLFNPTKNYDFVSDLQIDDIELKTLDEMKLLGLTLSNDLCWKANTENLTKNAYKRLWMIQGMKNQKAGSRG